MWVVVASVVGAVLAGLGALPVAASTTQEYRAAAVFTVVKRSPDVEFVSHSKTIVAQQTARQLDDGHADTIAESATGHTGDWVAGPGYGQVSYRVAASTADTANATVHAVVTGAGPRGAALFGDDERPARLRGGAVNAPVVEHAGRWLIVAGSAGVGAALTLGLLAAMGPGRLARATQMRAAKPSLQ